MTLKGWKKRMKKTIYILFPLFIYFASHDIIQFLLYILVNLLVGSGEQMANLLQENGAYVTAGVQILDMLLAMAVTWWVERYCRIHALFPEAEQAVLWKSMKCENNTCDPEADRQNDRRPTYNPRVYVVKCMLVFTALAVFLNCFLLQTGVNRFSGAFHVTSQGQLGTPVIMAILLFGIVSPLVEEYVFRYLLYSHMKCYFSAALSIGISALFFGIYHANLVQGLYGFFMGLYLAYSYECTLMAGVDQKKGMLVPMICHGFVNLLVFFGGRQGLFLMLPWWVAALLLLIGMVVEVLYYKKTYF